MAVLALVIVLAAAACGGSDTSDTSASDSTPSESAPFESAPEMPAPITPAPRASATTSTAVPPSEPTQPAVAQAPAGLTPEPTSPPTPEPTPVLDSDLPTVDLIDVATGDTVNLADYAPSERPIVLWFWAPH